MISTYLYIVDSTNLLANPFIKHLTKETLLVSKRCHTSTTTLIDTKNSKKLTHIYGYKNSHQENYFLRKTKF